MRSIFTIHAGEFLVGEHIEREFKKSVWLPAKDTGIDLLVTNQGNTNTITLQVKFSRDFLPMMKEPPSIQKGLRACAWFNLNPNKIIGSTADLWIFVLAGFAKRTYDYVIIKPAELSKRLDALRARSQNATIQTYIWVTEREKCWLTRGLQKQEKEAIAKGTFVDPDRDLAAYLNDKGWNAIKSL
ncbi:MAG: hypothetical protein WB760_14315 [Xanthobacteraceae bacterium]